MVMAALMKDTWRIAGIDFSHMHMGDLLRCVDNHPRAEIVGICDGQRDKMEAAIRSAEEKRTVRLEQSCPDE